MSKTACGWMIAGALLLCGSAPRAYGDSFELTWTGAYGPGSATLTATFLGGSAFVVTSMTGTQNGSPVSLLAQGAYGGNDNAIFPADATQLDFAGFAFEAGGVDFNLFAYRLPGNTNTYTECQSTVATFCSGADVNNGLAVTTLTITPSASAVPEPASIALVGTMTLAGVGLRRRRYSKT